MMKNIRLYVMMIICGFIFSCEFAQDLLNMDPPQISQYTPKNYLVSHEAIEFVSVNFTKEMNKTITEISFNLSANNTDLTGTYTWIGNQLRFKPICGFHENILYVMEISTQAEDNYGNSLNKSFYFKFFTGLENSPPSIISISPYDGTQIYNLREPITIVFSEPVEEQSFYTSFNLTPQVTGYFSWNSDFTSVIFSPLENYALDEEYYISISTDLTDLSSNNLSNEYSSYFIINSNPTEKVVVSYINNNGSSVILQDTSNVSLNTGIEKDSSFTMSFINPVEPSQMNSIISISPSSNESLHWGNVNTCTMSFPDKLTYNQIYTIDILDVTFRFKVTGDHSTPPKIVKLIFCEDIASPDFTELELNSIISIRNYSSIFDVPTACFDIYISHATGSDIDISSFLDSFSITIGNECANYSLLYVEKNPSSPSPIPAPGSETTIIRVYLKLYGSAGSIVAEPNGLVTIQITNDLKDTYQNLLVEIYTIILVKYIPG